MQISTKLETLLDEKKDDPVFAGSAPVQGLSAAIDLLKQQRSTTYNAELEHIRKVDRTVGGGALAVLKG